MTAPASGDKAAKTRGELLTGPVFPMVVKFGVPTMVSMLTPAIYNLTGAYFVSTLGTTAVAALGIVFSLHMILAAVGIMTRTGFAASPDLAPPFGAGEYGPRAIAARAFSSPCWAAWRSACWAYSLTSRSSGSWARRPRSCPTPCATPRFFSSARPSCARASPSTTCSEARRRVVGMGGILNLALTPAFILGLGFGIEGGLAAAVLPGGGSAHPRQSLPQEGGLLRIIPPTLERLRRLSPTILRNGMPSLLRNALAAVAASILNLTAGGFGDAAVAAMSIVSRVLMTVNAVMVGLGQGYQPVAGFNWGAGNYARVKKALVSTIVAGTAFTTAAAIPGFIFSESIVSVFAGGDPEVMETGTTAMRWASRASPSSPSR